MPYLAPDALAPTPRLHTDKPRPTYMITQHEFCCLAYQSQSAPPPPSPTSRTSLSKKRKTYLLIKHLTLRTQPIALLHQTINLLPALQHALNRLMQHNLRLVQLLLDLHDAVRLLRILVLNNIIPQGGEIERRGARHEGGARVAGEEFVDDFGEELVGD